MNKTIVISGASSGIGKDMLEIFVSLGHTVINLSRSNPQCFEILTLEKIETSMAKAYHIPCDMADKEQIERAGEILRVNFPFVDILINNAGLGISGATECLPDEDIEKVMNVDYLGALRLAREVLKTMPKTGRIVNISSVCAIFPLPFRGVYCSAKAAINMFSYSLRMELKDFGIRVISVCPGEIRTEFTTNRIKDNATNEKYGKSPRLSAEAIDKNNDKRMSSQKVAKKIVKISLKKNGTLYIIGAKYKLFNFLQRILPTRLFNKIIGRIFVVKEKKQK